MAKRIKDKRKRTVKTVGKENRELAYSHFKLIQAFPNVQERINYLRTLREEFEQDIYDFEEKHNIDHNLPDKEKIKLFEKIELAA